MHFFEATLGRIFVIRLEQNAIRHETVEALPFFPE